MDISEQASHCPHLLGDRKFGERVTVTEQTCIHASKKILGVGLAELVVGDLDCQHLVEVGAEIVADAADR